MLFAIVSAVLIGAFVGWYFWRKSNQHKKVPIEQRKYKEPPESFLLPKMNPKTNLFNQDSKMILFKNVDVFGHFENPVINELYDKAEKKFVPAGGFLFKPEEIDDSFYIVEKGKVLIYLTEDDGTEILVKEAGTGETVYSLVSLMEAIMELSQPTNIAAKAVEDTHVFQLHINLFKQIFIKYPESITKLVQIILLRLHRVTFLTLSQFLGLGKSLFVQNAKIPTDLNIHKVTPPKGKPKSAAVKKPVTIKRKSTQALLKPEMTNILNQANISKKELEESCEEKEISKDDPRWEILQAATKDLVNILQLEDESALKGCLQIIDIATNSFPDRENCIYFIISGKIKVYKKPKDTSQSKELLYTAIPGEFVEVLSVLTGGSDFFTYKAASYSYLVSIARANLYQILAEHPLAICGIANSLLRRLSPFVRQIDYGIDWKYLESGEALFRQGEKSKTAYLILNGRIRVVIEYSNGKREVDCELGHGDAVGLIGVISKSPRLTTAISIRDTELACLPLEAMNAIKIKKPQVALRLVRMFSNKIMHSYKKAMDLETYNFGKEAFNHEVISNICTISIFPVTPDVIPVYSHLSHHLTSALNTIVSTKLVTRKFLEEKIGSAITKDDNKHILRTFLGQLEDKYQMIVYQADATFTPWTSQCMRQADCILLLANADQAPDNEHLEKIMQQVESVASHVHKELVLLHKEGVECPSGTVKLLNAVGWVSAFFHVLCPETFYIQAINEKDESETMPSPPDKHSDIARLARRLTGTSVGLALGGGGARGAAHCGFIKGFREAGIPIDMVCGTSMGSFMGALYCDSRDADKVCKLAKNYFTPQESYKAISSAWTFIKGLTFPIVAMTDGQFLNEGVYDIFGEKQIEDLWLPYFCVSTDVTNSTIRVHKSGSLWKYIRSSMSLIGITPPLCDPEDGHLLLDGGYVNNIPADLLAFRGAKTVIIIDVASDFDNVITNYGESISGWKLLWNKYNPLAEKIKVPDQDELQSRLAYITSMRQLNAVLSNESWHYIKAPVAKFGTLEFGSYNEIYNAGVNHCKEILKEWSQDSHPMSQYITNKKKTLLVLRRSNIDLLEELESGTKGKKTTSVEELVAMAAEIPKLEAIDEENEDQDW